MCVNVCTDNLSKIHELDCMYVVGVDTLEREGNSRYSLKAVETWLSEALKEEENARERARRGLNQTWQLLHKKHGKNARNFRSLIRLARRKISTASRLSPALWSLVLSALRLLLLHLFPPLCPPTYLPVCFHHFDRSYIPASTYEASLSIRRF